MMKLKIKLLLMFFISTISYSQDILEKKDTSAHPSLLPDVYLFSNGENGTNFLPEVSGTMIYAAKKNLMLRFSQISGNKASGNLRELLSKVPGIHIWESDAGGVQAGIANRGLSPNRSWEFNVRQNGCNIAADPYGYPEAYYTPPSTTVQELEIVRGTASLQYGPQFGGYINYHLKSAKNMKNKFDIESEQTISSANLFSSYNGFAFRKKNIDGYMFFNHKNGAGWRSNSKIDNNTIHAELNYRINSFVTLTPEFTRFVLLSQQPGGLTDTEVYKEPQKSLRSRNWMNIEWNVPGLTCTFLKDSNLIIESKLSGIISNRNSVLFNAPITVEDTIMESTNAYANRTVQKDAYLNIEWETKMKTEYGKQQKKHVAILGFRFFRGNTHRLADGKGTTGTDAEFSISGVFNKDINFVSQNFALFTDNVFRINRRLLLTFGARMETISGTSEGINGYQSGAAILLRPVSKKRSFLLFGVGMEYHMKEIGEFYGGITQSYRPVLFSNLLSPPGNDVIDPNLQDSKGYVAEFGLRKKNRGNWTYDINGYYIRYAGKIGTLTQIKDSVNYRLLTNIGDSYSTGIEAFVEWRKKIVWNRQQWEFNIYATYSFNQSKYAKNLKDSSLNNKQVENAPRNILRAGLQITMNKWQIGYQFSYTDKSFSDANNTSMPTANAQAGIIPSYMVMDAHIQFKIQANMQFQAGINNVANKIYFTRRTGGLPGPGALPAEGRTVYFSFLKTI